MKFEAAATAPGFANSSQNGTEPSAKSIQTGFLVGSEQGSPVAAPGAAGRADAVRPATASSDSRKAALFIFERAKRRSKLAPGRASGLSVKRTSGGGLGEPGGSPSFHHYASSSGVSTSGISSARSEERRVGKGGCAGRCAERDEHECRVSVRDVQIGCASCWRRGAG